MPSSRNPDYRERSDKRRAEDKGEERFRRDFDAERRSREVPGDDYFYGGRNSQREDWGTRAYDQNSFDRREGMYQAGGREFEERAHDVDGRNNARGRSEISGNMRPTGAGSDRSWQDRRRVSSPVRPSEEHRHGFVESVKDFFGVGPKGYKRSDERIKEDVSEALARHPEVDASDIEVQVKDGHVVLSGTVENRWMRRQAEDAIEHVGGIEDVRIALALPRAVVAPELGPSPASAPNEKSSATRSGERRSKIQ